MSKYKFGLQYLKQETPKIIRNIADSILVSCTVISTATIIGNYHNVALICLVIGAACKGISSFFSDK